MQEKPDEDGFDLSILIDFYKKDYWIIVVCIITLIGCMYSLYRMNDYKDTINSYWMNQRMTRCICNDVLPFNESFKLYGGYLNGNIGKDQNPPGTS
jgi:hypothetical protein